jgi:hypothetical protein
MFTDLVTGDIPGASTYFNPLLRQTIIPCTSGARPGSPQTGTHIFETDTARLAKWTGAAWEYVAGSRLSFVPTLSASTPPTMGTGAVRSGHYVVMPGASVAYTFFIQFGNSGVAAGTGQYTVTLPITAAVPGGSGVFPAIGTIIALDTSASTILAGSCYVPGSNPSVVSLILNTAAATNTLPWVWAAGDYIAGTIVYPI